MTGKRSGHENHDLIQWYEIGMFGNVPVVMTDEREAYQDRMTWCNAGKGNKIMMLSYQLS